MTRRSALAALFLISSGCAANKVSVAYPRPRGPEETRLTRALGNLYVRIRKPAMPDRGLKGQALRSAAEALLPIGRAQFPVDAGVFARTLAGKLKDRGAHVLAYRVSRAGAADPFEALLAPAGILEASFETLDLGKEIVESEITVKNDDGTETKKKTYLTKVSARMTAHAALMEASSGARLSEFPLSFSYKDQVQGRIDDERDLHGWYRQAQGGLLREGARALAGRLAAPAAVSRRRALFTDKEESSSLAARKAFNAGKWEDAALLWAERLEDGKGTWRDVVNLAVAHEARREFAEARRIYADARAKAGSDPEAAKINWDEILADLDGAEAAVGGRSRAAEAWFAEPVAVLPFSDEVVNVDAPEFLRELTQRALRDGGYQVPDLIQVDRVLRDRGMARGGALKLEHAAQYASWLGARVVFGHVSDFEDIMLGAFGRRFVAGSLALHGMKGEPVWEGREPVVIEAAALGQKQAAANFAGQLFRGLFERMASKPMGAESAEFVRQNVETLPLRP